MKAAWQPMRAADAPAARELIGAVLKEFGLAPDPDGVDADLARLPGNYTERGGRFDVLVCPQAGVVGTAGLWPHDEHTVELRKMYLLPTQRGQGAGRAILDLYIAWARLRDYRRMVLETAAVLEGAIALYRHYGFMPYEPADLSCRCDLAMELRLQD